MKRPALIVDDEADQRDIIAMTLQQLGIASEQASSVNQAQKRLNQQSYAFCITDMRLGDGNGLDLVSFCQQQAPDMPVAVMTAYADVDSAVTALQRGAFDFVSKPYRLERIRRLAHSVQALPDQQAESARDKLLGNSHVMQSIRRLIAKVARSHAPVLVQGESGTGKELVARAIHGDSPRHDQPFVPVNCGAIPEHLIESELFGHQKGSFTGADQNRRGLFQAAHGGTLFLDEVAELPLNMQVKLLRALQENAIRPLGADSEIAIDVRIISATHRNLSQAVANHQFREDLYYRLNVIDLNLPPLRQRPEDIMLLASQYLAQLPCPWPDPWQLSQGAMEALQHHPFPGNVRELQNSLQKATALSDQALLTEQDLPFAAATATHPAITSAVPRDLDQYLQDQERQAIQQALAANQGNKTAAAGQLGISFRALRYRLQRLGLD